MIDKSNNLIEIAKHIFGTVECQKNEYFELDEQGLREFVEAVNGTGDYIKRSELGFDEWFSQFHTSDGDVLLCEESARRGWQAAIHHHTSIAVNKPDNEPVKVYQCPRCATAMEVDLTAKPSKGHFIEEVSDALPVEPYGWLYKGIDSRLKFTRIPPTTPNVNYFPVFTSPPDATMQSQADKENEQAVNDALEKAAVFAEGATAYTQFQTVEHYKMAGFIAESIRALIKP
jgi:hypothetical protein